MSTANISKKKVLILGQNSKIFGLLKPFKFWDNYEIVFMSLSKLSDKVLAPIECDYIVYFGYNRSSNLEKLTLSKIIGKAKFKHFIHLSSIVCILPSKFDFFLYVRNKKEIERYLQSSLKNSVISLRPARLIMASEKPVGLCCYISDFANTIEKILISPESGIQVPPMVFERPDVQNWLYSWLLTSKISRITRPVDIFLRILGFRCYGYGYLTYLMYTKDPQSFHEASSFQT